MKLKEIILEAGIAQGAGKTIRSAGKATGVATGIGGSFGSSLVQGIKQGFGGSAKGAAPRSLSKAKKSPMDSVDPRRMKEILDKILTGQQLDPQQLQILKDLKRKL